MARIVEFEGRRIEVPDDATDAEVAQIIGGGAAPTGGAIGIPAPPAESSPLYVLQRGDRGIADALGAPVDLTAAGLNIGAFGVDKIVEMFGGNFDARIPAEPFMGSDWIANHASDLYEAAGGHIVAPEDVSPAIRTTGTLARGAASALVPGMALASRPAQVAAEMRPALAAMTKPYATEAGATLTRDAIAGGTAAAGGEAYDRFAPDAVQESKFGPLAKMLAEMIGGVGGVTATGIGEGVVSAGKNAATRRFGAGDPHAPIDPITGKPFTASEMDTAAQVAQRIPSSRMHTLDNLEAGKFDFAPPDARPTVGMQSDDIGTALYENTLRSQDPQRFIERDTKRRAFASGQVDETAPRGANSRDFTTEAQRQYEETLAAAEQGVADAAQSQAQQAENIRRRNADLEAFRASQPSVSTAMAEDFDSARRAARQEKNNLYAAADPATPVDGRYLDEAVRRIADAMPEAERMNPGLYAEIADRVGRLIDDGQGGVRDITYGDLKVLRAQVSEARKAAINASGQSRAGSGADVERLDQLGTVINHLADQINPEAAANYRENYAPRFKTGKAGEYGAAMDRASRTGGESSATRPSEFGDKFLKKPEDAASLLRATPGQRTEQNAREWMLGDLAKSGVLTDNAEMRYDKFRQWADRNQETINQFPDLRREVDTELAAAQQGGALSQRLAQDVADARSRLRETQRELQASALSSALGKNPEKAVGSIMESGDPERQMGEMIGRLRGNQDATDGLKAAVRDWIKSRAGVSGTLLGNEDAAMMSQAKLTTLFKKHERTLAALYTPEEMQALRQAQKLLSAETSRDIRGTTGSNTVDKMNAQSRMASDQRKRILEAGLKLKYGMLVGGGVNRTINLFLDALPGKDRAMNDILFEMMFNPELAIHLLKRPVKEIGTPRWNARLNKLLAAAAGAREANEKREPTDIGTITEPAK